MRVPLEAQQRLGRALPVVLVDKLLNKRTQGADYSNLYRVNELGLATVHSKFYTTEFNNYIIFLLGGGVDVAAFRSE